MSKRLHVALAGNANVGKSVIFNHLTGLHQHIGNWPGKTVEKAEGTLYFKGYRIDVVDLPGIYSLSAYSIEEQITREYIVNERPDVIINVVDASTLERCLYFTLQLLELGVPVVVALNQMDVAKRKGIEIDVKKLEELLDVPVVPTVAIKGVGIYRLLERAVDVAERGEVKGVLARFGREIEDRIAKLMKELEGINYRYPPRYVAVKLLEGDEEIEKEIEKLNPKAVTLAKELCREIEELHGHSCPTVIVAERYEAVHRIVNEVQKIVVPRRPRIEDRIHDLTTHKIAGYPIMALIFLSVFYFVFTVGGYLSELLTSVLYGLEGVLHEILGSGALGRVVWSAVEGLIAGVTIALPYLIPFYLFLYVLEDSGYLNRVAFLMDGIMHKMGLHGKAFFPLILGYGCNVPACLSCRIMETERERLLAIFVVTLVPCAARTVVILGLVGTYLGIEWALALYVFDLAVILVLGRAAFKALPGEPTALIMAMPDYKVPHLGTVVKQSVFRLYEFIKIAFPLIILGSFTIGALDAAGLLELISLALSPITVAWLGLPAIAGIPLIFGILRKELTLVMLAALLGTEELASVLSPIQMVVFTIVTMFYVPCIATVATLVKEVGWKRALIITIFEIAFAITMGGVAYRILVLLV